MLFDIAAVLLLTFFAALGMVEGADWLLKHAFRKNISKKVYAVADVSSVPENDLEDAVRCLLAETDGMSRDLILDCRGASGMANEISLNLEKRFDCIAVFDEKELLSFIYSGLHKDEKTL